MFPGPTAPLLLAATLTACGMAGAATLQRSAPLDATGVRCSLVLTESGGLISLQAQATGPQTLTAHYGLSVVSTDGTVVIDQSGPARLIPGQDVTLSALAFTGRAGALRPSLTLTVAGVTQTCPVTRAE